MGGRTALGGEVSIRLWRTRNLAIPAKHAIVVIGAGGHAKVVIDSLNAMNEEILCCVGGADSPDKCGNVNVVKGDHHLQSLRQQGYDRAFIAIGSNERRLDVAARASGLGFHLVNAVHPRAIVSPSVRLGAGIAIMAGAVINAEAEIDDLAIVNTGATVDHDCRIGRAVHVGPQCALAGNVTVGAGAFLGIGTVVIPGIAIGRDVLAAAGSVVVSDVPAGARVAGVPARAMKS